MPDTHFLSISKEASSNIITIAAQHNLRAMDVGHGPNIDQRRSHMNRVLRGPNTADEIFCVARMLMNQAGVKLAKNTVRMVEILFSLPASTTINPDEYFELAVQWAERHFNVPILSGVIHLDESVPHCHLLLLPLVDGRMKGSDLVGGPSKMRAMQSDFYEKVAKQYGLARKESHSRLSAASRRRAADLALTALQSHKEHLSDPSVLEALRALIGAAPERLLHTLGLEMPSPIRQPRRKPAKSFVKQMTRVVKPDKTEYMKPNRVHEEKTVLGFHRSKKLEKEQTISCVGFPKLKLVK